MKKILSVSLYSLILSACSFVELVPNANNIIFSNDMDSCKKLGETEVAVLSTFMFMDRDPHTIAEELQILAQNGAVKMGGNAIWAVSDIVEGRQTFSILRCAPHN